MIAKDYRKLKDKGVGEVVVSGNQPTFLRPSYDTVTGSVVQTREDVIDTSYLLNRRAELVEEIKDIDTMIIDVGTALNIKSAELTEEKIIP